MRRSGSIAIALLCAGLVLACKPQQQEAQKPATAIEVREITGNTFELVPQLQDGTNFRYCLVFTRSQNGTVRQLTMTHENKSVSCQNGTPIANVRFRAPVDEGDVKVHVFFSDQKLNAGSIAAQLYEHKGDPSFHPMDLRLPGNVKVFTAEFKPRPSAAGATVGGEIGEAGEIMAPDAGTPGTAVEPDAGTSAGAAAPDAG